MSYHITSKENSAILVHQNVSESVYHDITSTTPILLRPYAVILYICRFNGNRQLRFHLINGNTFCLRLWALSIEQSIQRRNPTGSDIHLALLFCDDQ